MVVEVMRCGEREFVPVVKVQQGKEEMWISSRAEESFMAARFAAEELCQKLARLIANISLVRIQKTNGLVDRKATQAAV